jgi:hypothetical protein
VQFSCRFSWYSFCWDVSLSGLVAQPPTFTGTQTVPAGPACGRSVPRFNLSSQIEEPCEVGVGTNKTLLEVIQVFSVANKYEVFVIKPLKSKKIEGLVA